MSKKRRINQVSESGDFIGGVTDSKIKEIEDMLNVQLLESYKWFVKEYGMEVLEGLKS